MASFKADLTKRLEQKAAGIAAPPPLTIVVSPGPANARTDPATGLRFYNWKGRDLPSATTVRRMAGIPHGLHQWALNQVILRAVVDNDELQRMLTRERRPRERVLERNRVEEASSWLRAAATEERDKAALLGTAVHDAAAVGMDPDLVEPALRPRLRQFQHWKQTAAPQTLASEFQIFNLTEGYAGTADLLVRFGDGSVWLIDLKTGKGTYSEHLLQLLFYLMGEFVGTGDVIDPEVTDLLRRVQGIAVLHLADDHWEFLKLQADSGAWEAAKGLLRFGMWMHEHSDISDVTVGVRRGAA